MVSSNEAWSKLVASEQNAMGVFVFLSFGFISVVAVEMARHVLGTPIAFCSLATNLDQASFEETTTPSCHWDANLQYEDFRVFSYPIRSLS